MKKFFLFAAIAALVAGSIAIFANEDEYEYKKEEISRFYYKNDKKSDETMKLYENECAACHMAYQPQLLPKESWKKIMQSLDDHFGVDATLEPEDNKKILKYLVENSYGKSSFEDEFYEMRKSKNRDVPLRITETDYFKREHREIPKRLIKQKSVRGFSNCNACHTDAKEGHYGERGIYIPNYGLWDD